MFQDAVSITAISTIKKSAFCTLFLKQKSNLHKNKNPKRTVVGVTFGFCFLYNKQAENLSVFLPVYQFTTEKPAAA